jgi:hypothetical protein
MVLAVLAGAGYWWTTAHRAGPAIPAAAPDHTVAADAPVPAPVQPAGGTLTNDSIIAMAAGNVAPSVIESAIRASKTSFDLSPAELIRLSKAGVPAEVIEAMRNPADAPTATPAAGAVTLNDGDPVSLTLAQDIPRDALPGDAVRFKLGSDLMANGTVVAPAGSTALGSIVDGAKRKMLVFTGKMTLRLEKIQTADGRSIAIRATASPGRDGISKRPVEAGPVKRKDIASPAGVEYPGFIDGAQTIAPAGTR